MSRGESSQSQYCHYKKQFFHVSVVWILIADFQFCYTHGPGDHTCSLDMFYTVFQWCMVPYCLNNASTYSDGIRLIIPYIPTLLFSAMVFIAKSVLYFLRIKKECAI